MRFWLKIKSNIKLSFILWVYLNKIPFILIILSVRHHNINLLWVKSGVFWIILDKIIKDSLEKLDKENII